MRQWRYNVTVIVMKIRIVAAAFVLLAAFAVHAQRVREEMLVSPGWLQRRLGTVTVLHIGDRASYEAGHIPTAVLVDGIKNELQPVEELVAMLRAAGVDGKGRIVLYGVDPIPAARAWFTLDYLGHGHRTSLLDGGYARWVADGGQVSTEPVVAEKGTFAARVLPQALMPLAEVRARVGDEKAVLIDARPPAQFSGEEPGTGVTKPGHIPGAVNLPFGLHFAPNGAYKPADELRALYTAAGVTRRSDNVAYCRTGMQASVTYFVLRYLGYDAALYDGSYLEWSGAGEATEP